MSPTAPTEGVAPPVPPASNVNSQAVNAPQANVPVEPPPEEELVDEAAKPIRRERPKEPTRREREEHEDSCHANFRSWCKVCVEARGLGNQHREAHLDDDEKEQQVPTVGFDYYYMSQNETDTFPNLAVRDQRLGFYAATCVPAKGAGSYAVSFLVGVWRDLGHRRLMAKCDNEPAIPALRNSARDACRDVEVLYIGPPEGDHRANGLPESAVRELKRQTRAIRIHTERKLGRRLPDDHPALAWLPRFAAGVLNKYRIGVDGRTAEYRRTGKSWRKPCVQFLEKIFFRKLGEDGGSSYASRMMEGRYVGHHDRTGAVLAMTPQGVFRGKSFSRLAASDAWDAEGIETLCGVPWSMVDKQVKLSRKVTSGPEGAGPPLEPRAPVDRAPELEPRRRYVLSADVEKFGATPGCPGCESLMVHGRVVGTSHNQECRDRIGELLERAVEGQARLEAHRRRTAKDEEAAGESAQSAAPVPAEAEASAPPRRKRGGGAEEDPAAQRPRSVTPRGAKRSTEEEVQTEAERERKVKPHLPAPQGQKRPAVDFQEGGSSSSTAPASGQDFPAVETEDAPMVDQPEGMQLDEDVVLTSVVPAWPSTLRGIGKERLRPWVHAAVSDLIRESGAEAAWETTGDDLSALTQECLQLNAVDVMEIFSPPRFTEKASQFGLKPGVAIDLSTCKLDGTPWNLEDPNDEAELVKIQEEEEPALLTGGPPCSPFSTLAHLSKARSAPGEYEARLERGRHTLRVGCRAYTRQHEAGRWFLHEHPWGASSWAEPEMQELLHTPGIFCVKGPMCHWEMPPPPGRKGDGSVPEYVRKETGWMTNSPLLAKILEQSCSNDVGGKPWHRHISLVGWVAHFAARYPPRLVTAVLRGLREQMFASGAVASLEDDLSGPVPEEPDVPEDWKELLTEGADGFWDDVNGGWLPKAETEKARAEELEWVRKEQVYENRPRQEAVDAGIRPLDLLWVDTNKSVKPGTWTIRSRLCVREYKKKLKGGKIQRALPAAQLFSAMPPLEALKLLGSLLMSLPHSRAGRSLKVRHYDVSRAHFMGKAQRTIYIELPEEERQRLGPDVVGLLLRSMYGTQDASHIWQLDYVELLIAGGFTRGRHNAAVFFHFELGIYILCHGDDFVVLADEPGLSHVDRLLKSKYTVKNMGTIGFETGDDTELVILNRTLRVGSDAEGQYLDIVPDGRHADMIIKECGLKQGSKGVSTPREKQKDEVVMAALRGPRMSPGDATRFRSLTMRLAYLSQDRADLAETSKTLAQRMKEPTVPDWVNMKRVARYLSAKPRAFVRYRRQDFPTKLVGYGDSDWASCPVTRKSTSGLVFFLGGHCVKTSSNLQSIVTLSVGEAEFYALTKVCAVGLGIQALLSDWGLYLELEVLVDSTTAKSVGDRLGVSKIKHMQTRWLWVQERVQLGDLKVQHVSTHLNVADFLTKAVSAPCLEKHLMSAGILFA